MSATTNTTQQKTKGNTGAASAEEQRNWKDVSTDEEIVSWKAWDECKDKGFDSKQRIIGVPLGTKVLKEAEGDMPDWRVLVYRLTEPVKNVSEDGAVYDVPKGVDLLLPLTFKLQVLEAVASAAEDLPELSISRNGEKKISGPRAPMRLFKIQESGRMFKRSQIAPLSVALLAEQKAKAALPPAPFE
jgi:hypothetical protein